MSPKTITASASSTTEIDVASATEDELKHNSRSFNLDQRQFEALPGFIDYKSHPECYTTFIWKGLTYPTIMVQTSYPNSLYDTVEGQYLTISYTQYPMVNIPKLYPTPDSKSFPLRVHLIVGNMFIPNPDPINKVIVDHRFNNHNDWRHWALRWLTVAENNMNRYRPDDLRQWDVLPTDAYELVTYWSRHPWEFPINQYYYHPGDGDEDNECIIIRKHSKGRVWFEEKNLDNGVSVVINDINKKRHTVALSVVRKMYNNQTNYPQQRQNSSDSSDGDDFSEYSDDNNTSSLSQDVLDSLADFDMFAEFASESDRQEARNAFINRIQQRN